MTAKADLPVKICAACGRPMVWRRKWEKNWDAVKYCSERCRREAKARGRKASAANANPKGQAGIRSS